MTTAEPMGFLAKVRLLAWPTLLWLLLWGSYNTGIERVLEPGFPSDPLDFVHGVRALFALAALYLAVIVLLRRPQLPRWIWRGPLGLLALYAVVGLVPSALFSYERSTAVYWGLQHLSVVAVLWVILTGPHAHERIRWIMNMNWTAVLLLMGVLAIGLQIVSGVLVTRGGFAHTIDPETGRAVAMHNVLGMAATRSTGIARYAALAGLLALARLGGSWMRRLWWSVILGIAVYSLVTTNSRTAIAAFATGALVVVWLRWRFRLAFAVGIYAGALALMALGVHEIVWDYLTRERGFDATLSGRVTTWQNVWNYFLGSPVVGWGFHADRVALSDHVSNAPLHALLQSGLAGGIPFIVAMVGMYVLCARLWRAEGGGESRVPTEVVAMLIFLLLGSIMESMIAFFSSVWLFVAPMVAFLELEATRVREPRVAPAAV